MTINFQEFSVKGLFGTEDVSIPIKDNKLIIVGVNGLGKSTILNLFYFFISRQWKKMSDYEFLELSLKAKGRRFRVTREDLEDELDRQSYSNSRVRNIPPRYLARARQIANSPEFIKYISNDPITPKITQFLSERLELGHATLKRVRKDFVAEFSNEQPQQSGLEKADKFLKNHVTARILYLPTYRRIEKDLKYLFPHESDNIQVEALKRDKFSKGRNHLELVEFGMEDV
ncbi:AAA family ATPase, partial [Curvivirga aplysinae]|uniref:AAA family ATPase n=1 Tax=Curvivirga aplysinae TaxID=2529852 RepID=UPI001C3F507C